MKAPRSSFALLVLVVLTFTTQVTSQNTLTSVTANNTSGCSAPGGYCQGAFTSMSSASSGAYNAAPGNLSLADMHALEYGSATTALFVHFLPWFCMQSGSTTTGPGTSCNSHIQVGYNSNDPATVKAQMSDMQARGFQGPIIDWYGPNKAVENGTTQLVKAELESRCAGTTCPMSFAITEDQGSITSSCKVDGGGIDQSNCILTKLNSDLDYINANYFPSSAYLRVDATNMSVSQAGRPVVFFFFCEPCFTNPAPNWSYIWNQLRSHVLTYSTGSPLMWFIFRNSVGFTHTQTDGAFAWINHYGSNDPYGLVYLDDFYNNSLKYPVLQPWGASWKGFDNTNAPWHPTPSLTPQQCGNTWLQTFAEMTHNSDYSIVRQLPFLQVATWNDYEEGSEIETGIDNCLSMSASVNSTALSWTPTFSSSSGSENTIEHYSVYSTTDGQNLTLLATVPPGTNSIPLSSMNLASGTQTFYVQAVGKASILNKLSNGVVYPPAPASFTLSASPSSKNVNGGNNASYSITVAPQNGFTGLVTFSGSGLPAGTTATFSPTSVNTSGTTKLTVATTKSTISGSYRLTITGVSGSLSRSISVTLNVR